MKKIKAVGLVLILGLFLVACGRKSQYGDLDLGNTRDYSFEDDYFLQPANDRAGYKDWQEVKSVYMTGNTLSYKPRFEDMMDLLARSELDSLVIDVKDDFGHMSYESSDELIQAINQGVEIKDQDFNGTMNRIIAEDIYPIARIVTFKDRTAVNKLSASYIRSRDGSIWRDNKGDAWLNPYDRSSWDYPIRIAEEAALKGFKEIQFDYVRFPTDGKKDLIDYGDQAGGAKEDAIAGFLSYARERLSPYGVLVSADVFGLVTTARDDMNLGQNLESLATAVDIICPMVYPSHYGLGSYGIDYPDKNPYAIVKHSMEVAQDRLDKYETQEKKAILRPWLQDFSAPWLRAQYGSHYTPYGSKEIRAQKQATYDVGIRQWIFWNASNRYTEEGYMTN